MTLKGVKRGRRRFPALFLLMILAFLLYLVTCVYVAMFQPPFDHLDPRELVLDTPDIHGREGQRLYEPGSRSNLPDLPVPIRASKNCTEKHNLVFIKGMKCASTTMLGIFHRFGRTRNLTFVTPLGWKLYLNWPYPMTTRDFRPSAKTFNILTDHAIYTETVMESIMPPDTVYIGIVRHPFELFKSTLGYFKVDEIAGVPNNVENPVVEYLAHIEQYEAVYTAPGAQGRHCVPSGFSMTKNLMSHTLGMPLGFPPGSKDISNDPAAVDYYLSRLQKKFGLVLVVEHFFESLILLKRLMCWQFSDIVFVSANVLNYHFKHKPVSVETRNIHKRWSSIDYKLFEYFNSTLWMHIQQQGPDFFQEVDAFRVVEKQVSDYCTIVHSYGKASVLPQNFSSCAVRSSVWTSSFSIYPRDCWMLGHHTYYVLGERQLESNIRDVQLLNNFDKIPDNRTMRGVC